MNKIIATFAVVLTLSAGNLFADDGQVTDLDAFGLSSMQVVSDVQGMEVRGMATYTTVYGYSQSDFGGGNYGYQGYTGGSNNPTGTPSTAYGFSASASGIINFDSTGAFNGTAVGSFGGTFVFAQ